jgi:hypothetical protein
MSRTTRPEKKLGEQPGRDPRPGPELSAVGDAFAGQHTDQRALARSVRTDHADALAEVNLLGERGHQSGDPERAQVEHHAGRVTAPDPHGDRLVCDRRRRRPAGAESAPPRLHGVGAFGPVGGVASALLERLHQAEQPPFLLVPELDGVPEPTLAVLPCLGVRGV